jgi:hypothetical protein
MIRRVSPLTYEFEFSNNMNIHPITSVIHLKLILKNSNLYNRSRNDYPISVEKDL